MTTHLEPLMQHGPWMERRLVLPWSEVCMHMQVAGKEMTGRHIGNHMVQLLKDNGSNFSGPITEGEAGWGRMGSDLTLCRFDDQGHWSPLTPLEGATV